MVNDYNINYQSVVHFLTLVKYSNSSKAASKLYISQPALSLSISRLEKKIGFTLFNRENNKLILNSNGKRLYDYFNAVKIAQDNLYREIENLASTRHDSVNIAFSGSSLEFSAFAVSDFSSLQKDVLINLSYIDTEKAIPLLRSGQIDMVVSSNAIEESDITSLTLHSENFGIVINKKFNTYPSGNVTLAQIKKMKFHGLSMEQSFRRKTDKLFAQYGIVPRYISEDNMSIYYERIASSEDSLCFVASTDIYQSVFSPLNKYDFLTISDASISSETRLYYISGNPVVSDYGKIIDFIQNKITIFRNGTNELSNIISNALPITHRAGSTGFSPCPRLPGDSRVTDS